MYKQYYVVQDNGSSSGPGDSGLYNRIAVLRAERGTSRQALADAVGVNYQTIGFLERLGLETCVARSREDYVRIAAGLASDIERLADLRRHLRPRMAASPLCDGTLFTPTLEAAFREMWRRWSAGEGVQGFAIAPDGSAAVR